MLTGCNMVEKGEQQNKEQNEPKTEKSKFYSAKINNIETDDYGKWILKGTSSAPDGTEIIGVVSDGAKGEYGKKNTNIAYKEDDPTGGFSKVKNHKFTIEVMAEDIINDTDLEKLGYKGYVYLAAVSDYENNYGKETTDELPNAIANKIRKKEKKTLTLNKSLVEYSKNEHEESINAENYSDDEQDMDTDASETSSSEADNTPKSENVDPASFNRYFKKYVGKDVTISGTVLKIEKDDSTGHIITLTDGNYDNAVAVGVSIDVMETLGDVTLQEGDTITVDGAAVPGYSSTSIGGSERDIPGVEATDLKITSNY